MSLVSFTSRLERYREAIPLLEVAYHIDPKNHSNAYDLALAYRASGDLTQAREQVRKMLAVQGRS